VALTQADLRRLFELLNQELGRSETQGGGHVPCEACHGAHGEGMAAAHVPRIAGQSADYLKKQLDDHADGTRNNPIMANFAKALSEQRV
jgi:cytochrome c553